MLIGDDLVEPQTQQDNRSAWLRHCRVCWRRLGEGEGPVCSRASCADDSTVSVPFPIAASYGADGPEA
jgi:hypothetical protein